MRKRVSVLLLICCLVCFLAPIVFADNRDTIVFIASGSSSAYRYHARSSCPSLSHSVVAEITLEEAARRGFTACSRCHPPKLDFDVSATPRPKTEGGGSGSSSSSRRMYQSQSFASSSTVPDGSTTMVSPSNPSSKSTSHKIPAEFIFFLAFIAGCYIVIHVIVKRRERKAKEERQRLEQEKREKEAHDKWLEEKKTKEAERKAAQEKQEEIMRKRLDEWQKQHDERRRKEEEDRRSRREAFERKKQEYLDLYGGRSTLECCSAPPFCFIGEDGLPACKDGLAIEKWGYGYTFYKTPSGKVFHSPDCKYARRHDAIPVNAHDAKHHIIYSCGYCRPVVPDLTWYDRYRQIKTLRERYGIPEPEEHDNSGFERVTL